MNLGRREFLAGAGASIASSAMAKPIRSSLGGRLEYKVGENLPYDSEVEYLEGTGTQWIDTGYTSNHRDEVVSAIINNHKDITAIQAIFASWGSSPSTRMQLFKTTGRIGGNYVNFQVPGNKVTSVVADIPNLRFVIDGKQYLSSGMYAPVMEVPLTVFYRDITTRLGVFRLYGFTITRSYNLVMDLAPVRFLNEQGVIEGAMYDRASGELFRNQGTGSFIIGPDIS